MEKAPDWFLEHIEEDKKAFSARPTKEEMEDIVEKVVRKVLAEFFVNAGKGTRFWLITAASIVAALMVIFGGLKSVLAFIGIGYIGK